MTPERWLQIEELFHRAAECDPKQRNALLAAACKEDSELRREVESLLASEKRASHDLQAAVDSSLGVVTFPLAGQTVSHYRILDGIGVGGMGQVYAAEDLKLGRRVALKFLPEELITDSRALGRFEREARSASALEQPNICPIYEFGEHEGKPFLVMQLLEGQTLRELISGAAPGKPPLPVEQLIDLAIQIAEGLEAAHEKGIIHRDIKPANIFVTSKGQAKIMDFGLAKLAPVNRKARSDLAQVPNDPDNAEGPLPEAPSAGTPDPLISRTGVAMGTAGYMSPEQARGEKLDARTDLFSLGLVLYEMATGQRAFKGDTGPLLRDAILKSVPILPSRLNSQVPPRLERIISKALEKDRDARYQSVAEIRSDLKSLRRAMESRFHWRGVAAGVAILFLAVTAFFWVGRSRQPLLQTPREPKLTQLTVNSYENLIASGAMSPDGKYLAYSDISGMYIKELASGETRNVPQPEGWNSKNVLWEVVGWFPDSVRFVANAHPPGEQANLWSSKGTSIWITSGSGGAPSKLRAESIAWSVAPDGSSIAFGSKKGPFGEREVWLMAPTGENERRLLEADENSGITGLLWEPRGHRVLYDKKDKSGDTLLSRELNGGPLVAIFGPAEMEHVVDFIWLPDGRLMYSLSVPTTGVCNYWTVRLDLATAKPTEKPRQLTNWRDSCMGSISMTADGKRVAFVRWSSAMISYVGELPMGGKRLVNLRHFPQSESSDAINDWTPDSKEVIFISTRVGPIGIYKQRLDQEAGQPVVTGGFVARITPDGKWILFFRAGEAGEPFEGKPQTLMRVSSNGGAPQALLTARPYAFFGCAKSPSNLCVIAEPSQDRTEEIISSLDPVNGRGPELARFTLDPNDNNWWSALSYDGTRIATMRTAAGPIYILTVHGQVVRQIKVKDWDTLEEFSWAADGKGLFVIAATKGRRVLLYVDLQGNTHVLWEANTNAGGEIYVVPSPDGRHLALSSHTPHVNAWMMENF